MKRRTEEEGKGKRREERKGMQWTGQKRRGERGNRLPLIHYSI